MKNYLKENSQILRMISVLILLLGPIFSLVLTPLSVLLNKDLGDWLGFYGAIAGIVVSVIVIHCQMFLDKEKEVQKVRPEFSVENDYQLIKSGCRVYFDDKYWFMLEKKRQQDVVESNSFERRYLEKHKRDKAFSIEIVNNQPIFNLCILFGNTNKCERITKLGVDERIYVISRRHLEELQHYWNGLKTNFNHIPETITLYYTTQAGEKICDSYSLDCKGYCNLIDRKYSVNYPKFENEGTINDYFIQI
ncbi:hypothetical protein ACVR0P_03830 [Streptococcus castoreus]|uniref:hypothetical protein n=1 Tax=Streptococcus castoreus TaxID=254786 RepID=UPI0004197AA3|nr:hypothetical protein [Streptococcus castoreus]